MAASTSSAGVPVARAGGVRDLEERRLRLAPWTIALIALVMAGFVFALSLTPPLRQFEAWSIDTRLRYLAPPSLAANEIVIVAIDERVLADLPYRSPIDRGFLADLLEGLEAAGPRAIGLDILLDRPTEPAKDARFKALLTAHAVPVVVAWGGREDGLTAAQVAFLDGFTAEAVRAAAVLKADALDGRVRQVAGREPDGTPTIAGALALFAAGRPPASEPFFLAPVPTSGGSLFLTLPAGRVAQGAAALRAWVEDRIVLVGALLPADDRHAVGAGGSRDEAGVEVHANILARLLDGFQPRPAPGFVKPLVLLAATLLGTLLAALRMAEWLRGVLTLAAIAAFIGLAFAFAAVLVIIPVTPTIQGFFLAVAFTRARIAARDRIQRRFLQSAFGKYVSPAIIRHLVDDPGRLRIGGERREITALFTDLEGFTAMTGILAPEPMVRFLNGYLDGICQVVARHDGTMDKIVGDAVVCMFNTPLDQPDHAARAVRCALEIEAFARRFAAEQSAMLGHPVGRTRIGVATGPVTVGNFGGEVVFDYTAHGPAMNLAARLEGANRDFTTSICVDERTARSCPEMTFHPLGTVRAKGFAEPIAVFVPASLEKENHDA
jgi:class 3 adenylate cyclase/CHASE2 domain-containing sensor protein